MSYFRKPRAVVVYVLAISFETSTWASIRLLSHSCWVRPASFSCSSAVRSTAFSYESRYRLPALRAASHTCSLLSLTCSNAASNEGTPVLGVVVVAIGTSPWGDRVQCACSLAALEQAVSNNTPPRPNGYTAGLERSRPPKAL